MNRYVTNYTQQRLGSFGADDEDACATAESLIQALPAKWKALKTRIEAWSPTTQDKISQMQALGKRMDTWRTNFLDLANTMGPGVSNWLTFGKSWFWESQCEAIVIQLRTFETQLIAMNSQFTTISGEAGVPGADKPSAGVKSSGPVATAMDLAWGLLKIGAVGLGIWYGGKLLYQYLDERTRYPAQRLPRYAGGKRR